MPTGPIVYPGKDQNPALRRLLQMYGTYTAIGEKCGISQQAVSGWMRGTRRPSARACIRIEAATRGKVTFRQLRPDVFAR